jgi:hypothetical protein
MRSQEIGQKPSVSQLNELMAQGILLGKSHDKLRKSKKYDRTRSFFPAFIETEPERGELSLNNVYRYVGKISRSGFNKNKLWSMTIAEAGYLFDGSDMTDSYRSNYIFEWNENEVLKSKRKVILPSDEEDINLNLLPEKVDDIMFEADSLNAINEFERFTSTEFLELISRVKKFRQTSAGELELSYNR